jgi:hypothetical protein
MMRGWTPRFQSELIGDSGSVGQRDDRAPRAALSTCSRRAAAHGRHNQRDRVDVVGQLDRGVHDRGRSCVIVRALGAVDVWRLLGRLGQL